MTILNNLLEVFLLLDLLLNLLYLLLIYRLSKSLVSPNLNDDSYELNPLLGLLRQLVEV